MKNKFSLLVALMAFGFVVFFSQNTFAQSAEGAAFGIKVGPSFSNVTFKGDGEKPSTSLKTSFQGGFYANLPIADELYIQPSLMYEGKGAKFKATEGSGELNLNYVTLPINILLKPEMVNGAWFVGVGPYIGYGISSKMKVGNNSWDPFKKNGSNEADLKRFDGGLNVQAGYEFSAGFNIGINSNLGLVNISNDTNDDNEKMTNTSFGVTLGYTF